MEAIDAVLGTDGRLLQVFLEQVSTPDAPDFFRNVALMEQSATSIREYHPFLLPGLLQTDAYAYALIRSGRPWLSIDTVRRLVAARAARRSVLAKEQRPVAWFVLDEVVLRTGVGGTDVMLEQFAHLLSLAEGGIQLQLLPADTRMHPGISPFRLLTFREQPTVAYSEHAWGGETTTESTHIETLALMFGGAQSAADDTVTSAAKIKALIDG
ncbi:hypothetical protein CLV63_102374 [Murinocardiopsis flavida]|uniref:DUF5753 domain-containing protein n=1 Tax=Murinocardiopsis flavida TaxID=645275 RepID=A0A2P8DSQ9_9ACTN|nr:hypothetical protein CLV63_102374 [Murinocardiopsis flavida]